ncbi:hypothetical protein QYE76_036264 [Lolium multiflorum]|uniref:Ribonuclease H1 N-terminal domain-containing protein n=1 Tax=Lolium multiflorum TaxID=4521 RepID=A0AAD8VP79_LOLMU|nr:hypothetical protein QYE76_036264 [Lolium multiflorum]
MEMPTTYVVYKGRVPGVYDDWEDCRRQVHRFSGNSYKGYPTRVEAEGRYARYLAGEMRDMRRNRMKTMAFVMMVIVTMLGAEARLRFIIDMADARSQRVQHRNTNKADGLGAGRCRWRSRPSLLRHGRTGCRGLRRRLRCPCSCLRSLHVQALAVVELAAQPQQAASPPPDRLAMQQPAVVTPALLQLTTGLPAAPPACSSSVVSPQPGGRAAALGGGRYATTPSGSGAADLEGRFFFDTLFPREGGLAWGCCDTGGYITFYPCIDDLFSLTGLVSTALDFSIAGIHPAAAATHGPSSRCSTDGEAEWEVRSCGGWGGADG